MSFAPPIELPALTAESLTADYDVVAKAIDDAGDLDSLTSAIDTWDKLRRRLRTAQALVNLRYRQNTLDEDARAAREHFEALQPQMLARDSAIKRRLIAHERRADLERRFGAQAFRLWETDLKTYAPQIDDKLVLESNLILITHLLRVAHCSFGRKRNAIARGLWSGTSLFADVAVQHVSKS